MSGWRCLLLGHEVHRPKETGAAIEDPIAGIGRTFYEGICDRCGRHVHWSESNV